MALRVYFYMRIFERWYLGLCWNLGLVIELWYLEGFLVFLKGIFEDYIFTWWNIWVFIILFFFCLEILFNVNGKAIVWHTPWFSSNLQNTCPISMEMAILPNNLQLEYYFRTQVAKILHCGERKLIVLFLVLFHNSPTCFKMCCKFIKCHIE